MTAEIISTRTRSWTVANQFLASDRPVGTVVEETYAMIVHNGREPREYQITPHKGCKGDGFVYTIMEQWSNDTHCTGCDYYKYIGIGD